MFELIKAHIDARLPGSPPPLLGCAVLFLMAVLILGLLGAFVTLNPLWIVQTASGRAVILLGLAWSVAVFW